MSPSWGDNANAYRKSKNKCIIVRILTYLMRLPTLAIQWLGGQSPGGSLYGESFHRRAFISMTWPEVAAGVVKCEPCSGMECGCMEEIEKGIYYFRIVKKGKWDFGAGRFCCLSTIESRNNAMCANFVLIPNICHCNVSRNFDSCDILCISHLYSECELCV